MTASEETSGRLLGSGRIFEEVAHDLRSSLRGRPGWIAGISVNVVLAVCYLAYHRSATNFPDRGLVYIGAAIAAWCLADTLTTNQIGPEGQRASAALDGGVGIGRILLLKNLSLLVVLLMITLPISIAATAWAGQWSQLQDGVLVDLHVVLTWIALGNVVSVLLPYRPIPLKQRWRLRRSWSRWLVAIGMPYPLYLIVGWSAVPVQILARGRRNLHPERYALFSLTWGIGYWVVATLVATHLGEWQRGRLVQRLRKAY